MTGSDRRRRLRDAVEAALSDVMLLGTPEQVRLAVQAANDMVAGRNVETAALVASLRTFVREVLDLDEVPADVSIPKQGPLRPAGGSSRAASGERAGSGRICSAARMSFVQVSHAGKDQRPGQISAIRRQGRDQGYGSGLHNVQAGIGGGSRHDEMVPSSRPGVVALQGVAASP